MKKNKCDWCSQYLNPNLSDEEYTANRKAHIKAFHPRIWKEYQKEELEAKTA